MKDNSMNALLSQVSKIKQHYDEIAELRGENFNIFQILGVATKETKLHSALVAELLSPDGSHGKKDVFLKLFLETIKYPQFELKNPQVGIEVIAGRIDENFENGGRIDIVISNNSKQGIIIENKIYAVDQLKQLIRYDNYAKKYFENGYRILYLNLDGKLPAEDSIGDMHSGAHYHIITYKETIFAWLEECYKETVDQPILRETIKQYIFLIKQLTNQSYNQEMEKEIIETMQNNIASSFLIANNIDNLKSSLLEAFCEKLEIEFKTKFNNEINISWENRVGFNDTSINFTKEAWKLLVKVYFNGNFDPIIGIEVKDEFKNFNTIDNKNQFRNALNAINNEKVLNWDLWLWVTEYKSFISSPNDILSWESLRKESKLNQTMQDIVQIIDVISKNHG